jgi:hypothetical protein
MPQMVPRSSKSSVVKLSSIGFVNRVVAECRLTLLDNPSAVASRWAFGDAAQVYSQPHRGDVGTGNKVSKRCVLANRAAASLRAVSGSDRAGGR